MVCSNDLPKVNRSYSAALELIKPSWIGKSLSANTADCMLASEKAYSLPFLVIELISLSWDLMTSSNSTADRLPPRQASASEGDT